MSTGHGDGPSPESQDGQERRRTPPPNRRTPPPRTRSGSAGPVEHRAVQRAKSRGSVIGRLFGRQALDEALQDRFQPYEYESTRPVLRWLFIGLLIFVATSAVAVYLDIGFRSTVNEWLADGRTEIPISPDDVGQATVVADLELHDPDVLLCNEEELATFSVIANGCRNIDAVFAYAASEGFDCVTLEQLASVATNPTAPYAGCQSVVDLTTTFENMNSRSSLVSILLIVLMLIIAFPFSTFAHRSSRNLRTLRSDGQQHSPDGVVIRFFVPFVNLYKPLLMFIELFKASDPRLKPGDSETWQKRGIVSPIAILWGLSWAGFLIFNPITVTRILFNQRANLADVTSATGGLIAADILIIVLGILTILMANTLSKWQDVRAAKYGTITVTPPRPKDPLEKALEEGIRRQESSVAPGDDRSSKRRRK